ncbi:MAG TPA: hypothetical protein VK325_07525 [Pseudoxanthomonas sp.]|nr:hypothetical protein [Pseudoxanthomonas sp.]
MSALPSHTAAVHSLPNAGFSPRVTTEKRALMADTLWIKFNPDEKSGLQNFTPALVGEFQDVLDSLIGAAGAREAAPPYTVVQSTHPDYFSVGGDLRFFRHCIEKRDAPRLRDYSMSA